MFLIYVLVLRILAGLPTILMTESDRFFIFQESGVIEVKSKDASEFQAQISDKFWCLVDSNADLVGVPTCISDLGCFIVQAASPRATRLDWWTKARFAVDLYYMKEWSLSELIIG